MEKLLRITRNPHAVRAFVVVVCTVGLVLVVRSLLTDHIDLLVYREAGRTVLGGGALYERELLPGFNFTYTPWAAILFTPLALVPEGVGDAVAVFGNSALLVFAACTSWRALGTDRRSTTTALGLMTASVALVLEPVQTTVHIGQVNLLLLAVVLVDLLRDDRGPAKGIWVGIAAGIKLTPLFFVLYLLVTRRFRAAATALGAFVGTVVAGFVLLPADSATFWLGGTFASPARVFTDPTDPGNQSVRGLLVRWFGDSATTQVAWLVVVLAVAAAGLAVAAWASRRGAELLAVTLCGLCSAAVSPWSWGHHWVWLVPLLVFAAHQVLLQSHRWPLWAALVGLTALTFPKVVRIGMPPPGTPLDPRTPELVIAFLGNLYLVIFASALAVSALYLRSRASKRPEPGTASANPLSPNAADVHGGTDEARPCPVSGDTTSPSPAPGTHPSFRVLSP
ncbi:glycosyltransferase 87 family protein [Allokutzneria oryzae]|uniref:Glycosyltransferase 87 family protein n=1 Tax=Allokutzneria oryzae TaxID=1378989 RepID=A0ABV6A8W4_9PSEU